MDRGAWQVTVHWVAKSDAAEHKHKPLLNLLRECVLYCTLLFICSHGRCKAHMSTDIHMVTCYMSAVLVTQTVFPSQRFTRIPLTSSSTPPQSSSPSQARVQTCVHGQTWGIFPRVAKTSWVFLCGGLPLSLQLCWWFSNVHACSSEIGQSQPFSFRGRRGAVRVKGDTPARTVVSLRSFHHSQGHSAVEVLSTGLQPHLGFYCDPRVSRGIWDPGEGYHFWL